jgi:hypothetical protein
MLRIKYPTNPFFPASGVKGLTPKQVIFRGGGLRGNLKFPLGKGANPQTGNFSGVSLEKGANFLNHVFFNKSIIYGRILGCVKDTTLICIYLKFI